MGTRTGIMLCQPFEEKRLTKWATKEILCQPKLDGERCRVVVDKPNLFLVSSEGNLINSVPHIEASLRSMNLPIGTELDGEIYHHQMDFSEIHSRVGRTQNLHPDHERMALHIFDLVSPSPQMMRLSQLLNLLSDPPDFIKLVPTCLIDNDVEQIVDLCQLYCSEGYEGIIVRHPDAPYERKRSTKIMKLKPRKEDIYKIAGYSHEVDKDGNAKLDGLGRLCCFSEQEIDLPLLGEWPAKVELPNGYFGVGSGFTREQREVYWKERDTLPGLFVRIKYQSISPKRVPRFPIFSEIIEIN
jgi:DNA ligase 1